jgi:hypothetical protein
VMVFVRRRFNKYMWRCGGSLPNIVVAWKLEIAKCEQCYWWCATYARLYHF